MMLLASAPPSVTWIRVDPPRFDLVGVVLGSLGLAGALALLAMVLGVGLGIAFIAWRRNHDVGSGLAFGLSGALHDGHPGPADHR